jgi:hypothetical protein
MPLQLGTVVVLRRVRINTLLFPVCHHAESESERRAGTRLATAFHGHCKLKGINIFFFFWEGLSLQAKQHIS